MKRQFTTTLLLLTLPVLLAATALAGNGLPVPGPTVWHAPLLNTDSRDLSQFTFDTDNENWQETYVGLPAGYSYETLYPNGPALHTMSLGDPAGCIFQTVDTEVDQRAYWMGYYGDSGFFGDIRGLLLQANIYSTSNWRTISSENGGAGGDDGNVYARWVISWTNPSDPTQYAMYIARRGVSIDLNSFSGWTEVMINVEESNFLRWPNSDWSGPDFADVMANYDQIGMYVFSGTDDLNDVNGNGTTWFNDNGTSRLQHFGAYAGSGNATWALDNVVANTGVVATERTSLDKLKALYR